MEPKLRLIAFAPRCIRKNTRDFPGLECLRKDNLVKLSVETYQTAANFKVGLAENKEAPITLVSSHGGWKDYVKDGVVTRVFHFWSGREQLQCGSEEDALPAIKSHGVVISACNVLDENQSLPPLLRTAVQGRAWTAGMDLVPRSHVVWYAKHLLELERLEQVNSPQAALEALLKVDAILEAKRDRYRDQRLEKQRQKGDPETKSWRDLWSMPNI